MRKVKLSIACSIDGYIATLDGDISFLDQVAIPDEDYGYHAFIETIDTVIMGRKTYEKIRSFDIPFPHVHEKVYVFSHQKTGHDDHVTFVNEDVQSFIDHLKHQPGKDIFLDGGANLIQSFMKVNLMDEMTLSIIPVTLGEGISLFLPHQTYQAFERLSSQRFSSGLIQLVYQKKHQ